MGTQRVNNTKVILYIVHNLFVITFVSTAYILIVLKTGKIRYRHENALLMAARSLLSPAEITTFWRIYIPGHIRASSYFIGILCGYLKYEINKNNLKISFKWITLGWIMCAILMMFSLLIGAVFYIAKFPTWFSALYGTFYHVGWSLGIAWIIIVVSSGYGRLVDSILSWSPLVILSRLTYSVYLSHGAIQMYSAGIIRQPVFTSTFRTVSATAGDVILAYALAFVLTLLFEAPVIGLEKILWNYKSKRGIPKKIIGELKTDINLKPSVTRKKDEQPPQPSEESHI